MITTSANGGPRSDPSNPSSAVMANVLTPTSFWAHARSSPTRIPTPRQIAIFVAASGIEGARSGFIRPSQHGSSQHRLVSNVLTWLDCVGMLRVHRYLSNTWHAWLFTRFEMTGGLLLRHQPLGRLRIHTSSDFTGCT